MPLFYYFEVITSQSLDFTFPVNPNLSPDIVKFLSRKIKAIGNPCPCAGKKPNKKTYPGDYPFFVLCCTKPAGSTDYTDNIPKKTNPN